MTPRKIQRRRWNLRWRAMLQHANPNVKHVTAGYWLPEEARP